MLLPELQGSDFYPGRFYLLLNMPAFAGRTTGLAELPHTALQQASLRATL